jgi:hypothetical protein
MNLSRFLFRAAACAAVALSLAACSRNPMGTALPLNLADIPKIQAQLDKLKPEERELVLAYLDRSKGDVLPAKFADPDAPLTARTFAEAIKLQREFNAKMAVQDAAASVRRGARADAMAPLREALDIELLRREIATADSVSGRTPRPGQAINDRPVLVTTYRLRNTTAETITRLRASVTVRTQADPRSLMGAASCYIEHSEPISGGMTAEVRCGNANHSVGSAQKEFVDMPESTLVLGWEPKYIEFATGKVLKSAD